MSGQTHETYVHEETVEGPSDRSFGLTVGGILAAIGAVKAWIVWDVTWVAAALWLVGGALVAAALVAAPRLAPLNRAWMRLGLVLFRIVNPIVMFLIYATTVIPIGMAMRLAGKDLLRLRRDPAEASYWIERRPPGPAPETMPNQF